MFSACSSRCPTICLFSTVQFENLRKMNPISQALGNDPIWLMFLIHGLKPPTTLDSEMFLNLDNFIHVDNRESLWILMPFCHGCGVNGIQTLGWWRVRTMVSFCWVAQHLPNRFFFGWKILKNVMINRYDLVFSFGWFWMSFLGGVEAQQFAHLRYHPQKPRFRHCGQRGTLVVFGAQDSEGWNSAILRIMS